MLVRSWYLIIALCYLCVQPLHAAVFMLANGGSIEGTLLNPDQEPRENYIIAPLTGGKVILTDSQVIRMEEKSLALLWYETWLPKMPQTVDGNWTMAEECRKRGLKDERELHLQEVLKLDPEHEAARHGLGFSRVDNRWVNTDQWMTSQGYIRYRGSWRIPQDVALEKQAEEHEKREKEWKRKLKTWRGWIAKRRGQEKAALDAIRAIDDPTASGALIDVLNDKQAGSNLKRLCVDVLGRLQTPAGVRSLIDRSINDPSADVRDACLDQLESFGAMQAVRTFEGLLTSSDNKLVNRAATGLAILGRPEATLSLINALITEHKFLVTTGGGPGKFNLGFGGGPGGGGNSFSAGGQTKMVKTPLKNENVLNALISLYPGTNFGYDMESWKTWYARQRMPVTVRLRRSD
jgi:hypothetical protein